jgi:1-acyl-sn-glycerol-3-phosphate acyltransferase
MHEAQSSHVASDVQVYQLTTSPRTGALPASSWLLLLGFSMIARRRLRRGFRAVRMMHVERLRSAPAGPLVIYLNHPSWWDPIVCAELARRLLPGRKHRAPISTESLKRYRFFRHIGMFPVDQNSPRGAAQFLRGAQAILDAGGVLWITAEGHFTDPRTRPTHLASGLGALLHRTENVTVIPLAVEYTFWNQRLPEVLLNVGEPLFVVNGAERDMSSWTSMLEADLQAAQDDLAAASLTRNPKSFTTLLEGRRGMTGPYGLWQRMTARFRGEQYSGDHDAPSQEAL